jgi:hypothetical protein
MGSIHILGFNPKPNLTIKLHWKWYSSITEKILGFEPGDIIILNLIEVHNPEAVNQLRKIVEIVAQHDGDIIVISAPVKKFPGNLSNYDFLPWTPKSIDAIKSYDESFVTEERGAPDWVDRFRSSFSKILISPIVFTTIPSGSHILIRDRAHRPVSLSYKLPRGRILILPSIQPILHGDLSKTALHEICTFLGYIAVVIANPVGEVGGIPPKWLELISIRNEVELRNQYEALTKKLEELYDEKKILADDGLTLTRKIAVILNSLGFQTIEKDNLGDQDIEISDGEYRAIVECSGSTSSFNIDKLRQLLDYLTTEGVNHGMLVGNPWRKKHPKERDLSNAFSKKVLEKANQFGICLVTVPHLLRVYLDNQSESEKEAVRESLKTCKGLWEYPADIWK